MLNTDSSDFQVLLIYLIINKSFKYLTEWWKSCLLYDNQQNFNPGGEVVKRSEKIHLG